MKAKSTVSSPRKPRKAAIRAPISLEGFTPAAESADIEIRDREEVIAKMAYGIYEDRQRSGEPGTPEDDWFRAVERLEAITSTFVAGSA